MPSLYDFQEESVSELLGGKHFIIAGTGLGKGAIAMVYAVKRCEATGKKNILVVTTASKAHMSPTDFELDIDRWCGTGGRESLSSFSVISWAKLRAWVDAHKLADIDNYVYVFDEAAYAKAGVSSARGRAFLSITKKTQDWAGFTATPGENWLHFYPYFQACGLVKHKTAFMNRYANVQTYKGYPEIVGWRNEDELRDMWARISYAPDTRRALQELPKETHRVVTFSKPKGYQNVLKTRLTADGEFLDTTMGLMHYIRQLCFTKDKEQWIKDFLENLGERAIIFYSYIAEGDKLAKLAKKAVPDARIWRVDGRHHEVPTVETIGKKDIMLCQWQSGGEGINAQFINHFISTTPNYSYSTSLQARGRIQRIGATNPKFFWYLKCTDCVEEDIYKALHKKSDFAADAWLIGKGIKERGGISNKIMKEENE